MPLNLRIQPLNERSLMIAPSFGGEVGIAERNATIHGICESLRPIVGVVDVVAAYESLAVFFSDIDSRRRAQAHLSSLQIPLAQETWNRGTLHEIPVVYDGLDLDDAASELGMRPDELIALHSAVEYSVAMIGFLPGFPYLLGMDPRLTLPRLATPRLSVPQGSVAIGGAQTGIYPQESPGGWRLIGTTDAVLFDAAREKPALLQAGDRVKFVVRNP